MPAPPKPDATIKEFCEEYVEPLLSMDLKARGYKMQVYGPDDAPCRGNMVLRNLYELDPKETEEDRQLKIVTENEIAAIKKAGTKQIKEMSKGRANPSVTVCRGYIEALIEQFGMDAYTEAFDNADI